MTAQIRRTAKRICTGSLQPLQQQLQKWQQTMRSSSLYRVIEQRWQPVPESADYRSWRQQFMLKRLRLSWWIAVIGYCLIIPNSVYGVFINPQPLINDVKLLGDPTLFERIRIWVMVSWPTAVLLLAVTRILLNTRWAKRHPSVLFLLFSWSLNLVPAQVIGSFLRIPDLPDTFVLMAQAILIPVHWQLHLVAQLIPVAYYVGVYPLLGITSFGNRSIYQVGIITDLFLVCLICDLGVYLYERLKRSEFEAQRRLKIFLHSVAHDLRTPVMGASLLLNSLLHSAKDGEVRVKATVIEQLVNGSDRLLSLMNSLLDVQTRETAELTLHRQPVSLAALVDSVLASLEPTIAKNRIHLSNHIRDSLPAIKADPDHLWRVLCNLLSNALKHNPPGICLTLDAEVIKQRIKETIERRKADKTFPSPPHAPSPLLIRCTIQDTGIGIPIEQQPQLFEMYTRGDRAAYTPGLGLGLYLCKQIITAHGGEIGVISKPGQGSMFWFTLAVAAEPPERY